jgi:uncharacterized membrane protein
MITHSDWDSDCGWYDLVFIWLGVIMFCPDLILTWINEEMNGKFGWWHVIWLEIISVATIIVGMILLKPIYPKLSWWNPMIFVGSIALLRGIMRLAKDFIDFDDS